MDGAREVEEQRELKKEMRREMGGDRERDGEIDNERVVRYISLKIQSFSQTI